MEKHVLDNMKEKLVKTTTHLIEVELDKKATVEGFNEEIKGAKKRINALAKAIKERDLGYLHDIFSKEEIEFFEKTLEEQETFYKPKNMEIEIEVKTPDIKEQEGLPEDELAFN